MWVPTAYTAKPFVTSEARYRKPAVGFLLRLDSPHGLAQNDQRREELPVSEVTEVFRKQAFAPGGSRRIHSR